MKYKLAIFDMDGTILNTLDDLAGSLNYALENCGYPIRAKVEIRNFLGNGVRRLIEQGVPEGTSAEEVERVMAVFLAYYREHNEVETRPYEGIPELIKELEDAGMQTAVISNKIDDAVKSLCVKYFPGRFSATVGEREGVRRKPAPDAAEAVLVELGVEKCDAVYIGDSEVDFQTAVNTELDHIIVTWGFRDREYLESIGATNFAESVEELKEKLL